MISFIESNCILNLRYGNVVYNKENLERQETNMEGGQSGTYLRLTRASSGPEVRVAKTYRDELKMNILAKSQWPSSAVEYRYGKGDIGLITAPVKTAMCSKVNFTVE